MFMIKRKKVSGAGAKESTLEEGEIEESITAAENVPLVINKKKPSKDDSADDKVTSKLSKEWKDSDAASILVDLAGGEAAADKEEEIVSQKEARKSDTLIDSAAGKNQPEKMSQFMQPQRLWVKK